MLAEFPASEAAGRIFDKTNGAAIGVPARHRFGFDLVESANRRRRAVAYLVSSRQLAAFAAAWLPALAWVAEFSFVSLERPPLRTVRGAASRDSHQCSSLGRGDVGWLIQAGHDH